MSDVESMCKTQSLWHIPTAVLPAYTISIIQCSKTKRRSFDAISNLVVFCLNVDQQPVNLFATVGKWKVFGLVSRPYFSVKCAYFI